MNMLRSSVDLMALGTQCNSDEQAYRNAVMLLMGALARPSSAIPRLNKSARQRFCLVRTGAGPSRP